MNNLKEVYIDSLQDLYSANEQTIKISRKLAEAAGEQDLKEAIQRGNQQIEEHNNKLAELIRGHDAEPKGEHCKGMEGLVTEAKAHVLDKEFGNDAARDAMIIAQYQRMTHYAIAGVGSCAAFAKQLGLDEEGRVLYKHLEEIYQGDRVMNRIAEGEVNKAAA
jgi:ferritin-like metal-binding protein YciE